MRVCPGCGVIAPVSRTDCVACGRQYGASPPTVGPRPDGWYWACVLECDFACRGCGMRSPLDSLDNDGEVECRRCGLTQAFDGDQWNDVLAFAQDVADCAGPEGRLGKPKVHDNPYAAIGRDKTYAEKTLSGMIIDGEGMKPRTLRLRAAPGIPLCERCCVPLEVVVDTNEYKTTATCPHCHDHAHYDTPGEAFDANGDIAAILADDHRCDREAVRVQPSPGGGAVAIACPRCNAALPVTDGSTFVNCSYCSTPCRVPSKLLHRLGGTPKPKRWWILFDDDSNLRNGVDPDKDDDDDDDDDHDHDDVDDRMARVRAAQAAEAAARAQRTAPTASNGPAVVGVALGAVAVLAAGIVAFSMVKKGASSSAAEPAEPAVTHAAKKSAPDDDDAPKKKPAEKPKDEPIVRSKFRDMQGCSCKVGKDTRQLALRVDTSGVGMTVGEDDGFVANFDLSWLVDSGGSFFLLRAEDATSPPSHVKGRGLSVGVACNGDVFAVIAKDHATGWSLSTKKPLWDVPLDADYNLAVTPSQKGLNVQCAAIDASKGSLRIPLLGGKTKIVDMKTGK